MTTHAAPILLVIIGIAWLVAVVSVFKAQPPGKAPLVTFIVVAPWIWLFIADSMDTKRDVRSIIEASRCEQKCDLIEPTDPPHCVRKTADAQCPPRAMREELGRQRLLETLRRLHENDNMCRPTTVRVFGPGTFRITTH